MCIRDRYQRRVHGRLQAICPNMASLAGENVGARLISHAGGLTNLAKLPASTIQILGAEKALFRALKSKTNTPKYGLIYHSSFIGRAGTQNKGRISRSLANKIALATRIDAFSIKETDKFGETFKDQIEERMKFFSNGPKPRKNSDVMKEVLDELRMDGLYVDTVPEAEVEAEPMKEEEEAPVSKPKKKKSAKKKKSMTCLLYTSPSPRDLSTSRMPSSA
eukprot:TRINITY_DN4085_c0_g1_i3.p1 TRINITY_DN4085_c0_g1~~TRINITY_DN4085_c0_g1_i3.p1  ORF type:complete len:220 (-),score=66.91 TRINITY_DN4085_c0_g1_i3:23-682(-)